MSDKPRPIDPVEASRLAREALEAAERERSESCRPSRKITAGVILPAVMIASIEGEETPWVFEINKMEPEEEAKSPMKRYRLLRDPPGGLSQEFVEHPDGEWVSWREVKQGQSEETKAPEAPKAERLEPDEPYSPEHVLPTECRWCGEVKWGPTSSWACGSGRDLPTRILDHRNWQSSECRIRELRADLTALRRWIEEQKCRCRVCGETRCKVNCPWKVAPCSRCLKVAEWDRAKVSGHPGLKESEVG